MTHELTTDTESPDRETVSFWTRVRRGALLMVGAVVMYLLMTGPLLWSYSKIDNDAWHSFVRISLAPILKLETYEKSDYFDSLGPLKDPFLDPHNWADDPPWLSGLKWYWDLFGDDPNRLYFFLSILEWQEVY
jgi:hypothetical protein